MKYKVAWSMNAKPLVDLFDSDSRAEHTMSLLKLAVHSLWRDMDMYKTSIALREESGEETEQEGNDPLEYAFVYEMDFGAAGYDPRSGLMTVWLKEDTETENNGKEQEK